LSVPDGSQSHSHFGLGLDPWGPPRQVGSPAQTAHGVRRVGANPLAATRHSAVHRLRFDNSFDNNQANTVQYQMDRARLKRVDLNTNRTVSHSQWTPLSRSLNPKVQGSIPCASTNMFVQVRLKRTKGLRLMFVSPSADALRLLRLRLDTPSHEGNERVRADRSECLHSPSCQRTLAECAGTHSLVSPR
jgi:hypothetical protein